MNDSDDVLFKIDTGADVTILPSDIKLNKKIRLTPTSKTFSGANGKALSILGTATVKLSHNHKTCYETIYVSKGTSQPLLGKPAITSLQLLARINEIQPSSNDWYDRHPKLFEGLGSIDVKYKVELKNNANPFAINTPRRIPLPLWESTKEELERMVSMGVIAEVHHATDWCSPMVVVPKKDSNKVRICVDLTKLNRCVKRRYYPIQPIDITLAQISEAKCYSKLDANNGFWQITVDEESQDLTTFLTPFGRFKFLKLPFGITSAPEVFQECVNRTLKGQMNALAHMDDIIVWGKTQQEHDYFLEEVLTKLECAGFTLNKDKCLFSQTSLTYLGHHLSESGIKVDETKVEAIRKMAPPTDILGVQRLLGMVNFIGKYIPNKSRLLKPITDLLSRKNEWCWGCEQQKAFDELKELLASPPQLAFYDKNKPTMISADSSTQGLGGVLLQQQSDGNWKPISYISRTLSETERNYSNIEREALSLTWSCDKFKDYIVGEHITLETDHKPLVSILTTKEINDMTPRLQRLRLRLMRYSYNVTYTPGKHLATADCLSRSPVAANESYDLDEEVELAIHTVTRNIAYVTDMVLDRIASAQRASSELRVIKSYCSTEWPDKTKIPDNLKPYFTVRDEISFCDGLLLRGERLIIPTTLRKEMLTRIHTGHLGITKCRLRANNSMWWPGMSLDIEKFVNDCPKCTEHRTQHHEPLLPSELPSRPWEKAAIDLFKLEGTWFVVITDCFSRYFEIATLKNLSTAEIIEKCKSVFCRHGIPIELRSDCGTQFATRYTGLENSEFKKFAQSYNFKLVTSSPSYHQSNGAAEAAVKIAKSVLKKNKDDPYLALLTYRNTPLSTSGYSPAQLIYNRSLRDNLPVLPKKLEIKPDLSQLKEKEDTYKASYKRNYDRRYATKELPSLPVGKKVWIQDLKREGIIISLGQEPRSYWVKTGNTTLRRNRHHLLPYKGNTTKPNNPIPLSIKDTTSDPLPFTTVTQNNSSLSNTAERTTTTPSRITQDKSKPFSRSTTPNQEAAIKQSSRGRIIRPTKRFPD
ncbi:uncharacterized protein K02A2.6-like [Macrosteles quadrilineatus]|uniref:uncharacterized protein K02A2.6-like n=1 Tax=Macrosteles quadrilineatus TaxID=74068 RepID=UPI0023E11FB3|nr:uncharacterized protein K02A2.6-like [Macrosteles quadrilineatus]